MDRISSLASSVALGLVLWLGPGARPAHPALFVALPTVDVEGIWLGTLKGPGFELRIVFHITRDAAGALTATLDSPDQGAEGIPVGSVVVTGDSLLMDVPAVLGGYKGKISSDGHTIDGQWSQSGQSLPLVLTRSDAEIVVRRPQEPEAPYPYDEEAVTFEHAGAGVTLAGTLTLPRTPAPFAAVVLISGSGPQDRNEALMGHKPFLVLADYLTRRGVAVLRYDDRGVGESTGVFAGGTSRDFAGDALAAVAYLKSRPEIDPAKIGLVGHSEGGLIAPMAASSSSDVAFIVLMAGPGVTGEEILYAQGALIARANGASEEAVARQRALQERIFGVLKSDLDSDAVGAQLRVLVKEGLDAMSDEEKQEAGFAGVDEETLIERQVQPMNSPWFRYFLSYDPAPTLRQVTCPVLAVNGARDLQVPPGENLRAIEAALKEGGNDAVTLVELDGLNHLFQTAETGSPLEYAQIEETFSPQALAVIGDWIVEQTSE
jgi:hypothetical protein